MKVYVLLDENNFIDSYMFDTYEGATGIELEDGADISKLICYKYENNELVYSQERENNLKQKEIDYKSNYVAPMTESERITLLEQATNDLVMTVMGGM